LSIRRQFEPPLKTLDASIKLVDPVALASGVQVGARLMVLKGGQSSFDIPKITLDISLRRPKFVKKRLQMFEDETVDVLHHVRACLGYSAFNISISVCQLQMQKGT
jgi:hypothetical protein